MPIYTGKLTAADAPGVFSENYNLGLGLKEAVQLQAMENWTPLISDFIVSKISDPGKHLSRDEAEKVAASYGVSGINIPDSGVGEFQLGSMIRRREKMQRLERRIAASSQTIGAKSIRLGAQIFTGLIDQRMF